MSPSRVGDIGMAWEAPSSLTEGKPWPGDSHGIAALPPGLMLRGRSRQPRQPTPWHAAQSSHQRCKSRSLGQRISVSLPVGLVLRPFVTLAAIASRAYTAAR